MCKPISSLSSGDGKVYYFTPAQRLAEVQPENGTYNYDSHTSIAHFYRINEDTHNKYEWNPYTGKLVLDQQNTADDRAAVLAAMNAEDWSPIFGDIEGMKKFLAGLSSLNWLDNHGQVPDGVKMFETQSAAEAAARTAARDAARDAVWAAAREAAWDAVWAAARDAAWDAARDAARDAVWAAAREAAWDAARNAAFDTALYAVIRYVCSGLPIAQEHIDHVNKRWSVWEAGYVVYCDINGELYCYKTI